MFSLPCCPDAEKVWHQTPQEEIDLAEKSVFGAQAWPQGLQDLNQLPKNYLQRVKLTLKTWPQYDDGVIMFQGILKLCFMQYP